MNLTDKEIEEALERCKLKKRTTHPANGPDFVLPRALMELQELRLDYQSLCNFSDEAQDRAEKAESKLEKATRMLEYYESLASIRGEKEGDKK